MALVTGETSTQRSTPTTSTNFQQVSSAIRSHLKNIRSGTSQTTTTPQTSSNPGTSDSGNNHPGSSIRITTQKTDTKVKGNERQTPQSTATITPTSSLSLQTPVIDARQTASTPSLILRTAEQSGKTQIQNYQQTVQNRRAESKATNTQIARDFISYIDKGYESEKISDNLRSLAIDLILPTTLIRNELDRTDGTLNTKDPDRAIGTIADTLSLIPIFGGLAGGAAKLTTKGSTTLVKGISSATKTAESTAAALKIGDTATKAITKEADMGKLTALTKILKKATPKKSTPASKPVTRATTNRASTRGKTTTTTRTTKGTTVNINLPKSTARTQGVTKARAVNKAPATTPASRGSKALNTLGTVGNVGSLALTGLWGYSLINDLMNPDSVDPHVEPVEETLLEDSGIYEDSGLFDTGIAGAYNSAEETVEEWMEPLEDVPVVGDIVESAAESGLSLPLLAGVVIAGVALAYVAYSKYAKKGGNKKSSAKKSPKHKVKGAAA